jgi:hypothetical protein
MNTFLAKITRELTVSFYDNVRTAQASGNNGWLVDSAEALELRTDLSGGDMVKLFNGMIGADKPVNKFADRKTACKRLWAKLVEVGEKALKEKPKPVVAPSTAVDVAPKAKAKKEKKPKGEKAQRATKVMDKALFPASKENPYRANTKSHDTYELILAKPGKTIREYADMGGRLNTLRAAVRDEFVRFE